MKSTSIAGHMKAILEALGEDPTREGLQRTPKRVEESLQFLTSGYRMELDELVNDAVFSEEGSEMILVRDLELYSLCEHHMLPFVGRVCVAYIPNGKILGLSKVARIVDMYARRLQVQERLTKEIAQAIEEVLNPLGVAVVVEAKHFCMMMRGVQKQNSYATTSCMLGAFMNDSKTRAEFLSLSARSLR